MMVIKSLFLLLPFGLFAGVVCTPLPDGSWICSGDGGASGGGVVTNIVGVCTNCTAMTPSDCVEIKRSLNEELIIAQDYILEARTELNYALYEVNKILDEGDSFTPVQSWTSTSDSVLTAPQHQYTLSNTGNSSTSNPALVGAGNNSIVNYYQQAVKPSLELVKYNLETSLPALNNAHDGIEWLETDVVSSIDCSTCEASFDGGGDPVVTNSPPSSSVTCPCEEQMKALQNLLKDDFLPRIKSIDSNVKLLTNIVTIAKEQLSVVKEGMHNISNLLLRLDDYVLDDFSQRVYQIRFDVNYIASNLRQRVSFIDQQYSNSTFYVSVDGSKDIDIQGLEAQLVTEDADGNISFDWGEYKDLTWFGRVEYLLLRMNGLYSLEESEEETDDPESVADEIEESSDSFNQSLDDAKVSFDRVKSSAANFFDAVDSTFAGSSMSSYPEIVLISNYLNTGEDLSLKIDEDVIDACRVVTSLLWTAGASVLLFRLVIVFWMYTADVIWLMLKHITDTVK